MGAIDKRAEKEKGDYVSEIITDKINRVGPLLGWLDVCGAGTGKLYSLRSDS